MARDDHEMHREWLTAVVDHGANLTPWEQQFIESLSDQITRGHRLSEKQVEILERLYAEKTP
jgi:hypothetical protein